MLAVLAGALVAVPAGPAVAAECMTSGPATGAYTTTVCLTAPSSGDVLSGDTTVSAVVTTSPGGSGTNLVTFTLDGTYVLSDYEAPFTFRLPTSWWADGSHVLAAQAYLWDGFAPTPPDRAVVFSNGVAAVPPAPAPTFVPKGREPAPSAPLVVAATGDAAGGRPAAQAVSDQVVSWDPDLFLYVGDVYNRGSRTEFDNWYGRSDSLFGRLRDVTNPTVGNHEYSTPGAAGYKQYWDGVPLSYSYDRGGWHFVSLDSTTALAQVTPGTAQFEWLRKDLAASTADCTLVYFHHPVRSVGKYAGDTRLDALWNLVAAQGVDLVLAGHDHNYQRWVPLDAAGQPAALGTTQVVVGGGGHGLHEVTGNDSRVAFASGKDPDAYGALRMELTPTGGSYRYVTQTGATLDSSSLTCSPALGPDTVAPSAPTGLTGTAEADGTARLSWDAATDDRRVAGYDVLRDGAVVGQIATTSFTDSPPPGPHRYEVRAVDEAGNTSGLSAPVSVTTSSAVVFSTGFESGDLRDWTTSSGLRVEQVPGATATWAARPLSSGAGSWARRTLPSPLAEVAVSARVRVAARGTNSCWLKVQTPYDNIADLCTDASGRLYSWNYVARAGVFSSTVVPTGAWHDVELRVRTGPSGGISVRYDGADVADLARNAAYGTGAVTTVQVGMEDGGRSYDLAVDDVRVVNSAAVVPAPTPTESPTPTPSVTVSPTPGASETAAPEPTMGPVVPREPLFRDDFETGGLSRWTSSTLMSVGTAHRVSGSFGARATSTGASVFARRTLDAAHPEIYSSAYVKIISKSNKEVFLLKVRAGSRSVAGVYASSKGMLGFKNEVTGTRVTTSRRLSDGAWHLIELRSLVAGSTSASDVWLDGVLVPELQRRDSLGTAGVSVVQIGESTASGASDVAYDDVWVDTQRRP